MTVLFVAHSSQITSGYAPRSRLDHAQNPSAKICTLFLYRPLGNPKKINRQICLRRTSSVSLCSLNVSSLIRRACVPRPVCPARRIFADLFLSNCLITSGCPAAVKSAAKKIEDAVSAAAYCDGVAQKVAGAEGNIVATNGKAGYKK